MTPDERAELKKAAEAATGPWRLHDMESDAIVAEQFPNKRSGAEVANTANSCWQDTKLEDAYYISRAHPAAILDLLAENERLRDVLSNIADLFPTHAPSCPYWEQPSRRCNCDWGRGMDLIRAALGDEP